MKKLFGRRQRIYVFPNLAGFIAFAIFLVMLATAATYQNNLIFAMAFLIISLALVAILQTARNVRDIEALSVHIQSNFASSPTLALMNLTNQASDTKINLDVYAEFRGGVDNKTILRIPFAITSLEKQATNSFSTQMTIPKIRGRYLLRRICVSTCAPYGLFRAWIYLDAKSEFIAYPAANGIRDLPSAHLSQGEDFSGHKLYSPGDSMSRIDWKVYSRRRELYIKEFRDGANPQIDFSLNEIDPNRIETKLSQLSLWISEAYQKQYAFRLETTKFNIDYGRDKNHFHRCLTELALWTA